MTMDHNQFEEHLEDYLRGTLSPAQTAAFEQVLASDKSMSATVRRIYHLD